MGGNRISVPEDDARYTCSKKDLVERNSGGSGAIFRARDSMTGRSVMLTVTTGAHSHHTPTDIVHPHVAAFLESFVARGKAFRLQQLKEEPEVMVDVHEYLAGGSVRGLIRGIQEGEQDVLSPSELVRFTRDVCSGLAYIHRRGNAGIVAGRLCPENVRFNDCGAAKVVLRGGAASQYHSPERSANLGFSTEDDMWAFGLMLLELSVGREITDVVDTSALTSSPAECERILNETMSRFSGRIPSSLVIVVRGLLQWYRESRWSAGELLEMLKNEEEFLQERYASADPELVRAHLRRIASDATAGDGDESLRPPAVWLAVVRNEESRLRLLTDIGCGDVSCGGVPASALRPALWHRVMGERVGVDDDAWSVPDSLGEALSSLVGMITDIADVTEDVICRRILACIDVHGVGVLKDVDCHSRVVGLREGCWTLLGACAACGLECACRLCLALGSSVHLGGSGGVGSPLWLACESGHTRCAAVLLSYAARPDERDAKTGQTLLHLTSARGHDECTDMLLGHGTSVHSVDAAGETPFSVASSCGQRRCCRVLLRHGAHRRPATVEEGKELRVAAGDGDEERLRHLLDLGVDPNSEHCKSGDDGKTPLMLAGENNHRACAGALLEHGAARRPATQEEGRDLTRAVAGQDLDRMRAVLSLGIDPDSAHCLGSFGSVPLSGALILGLRDAAVVLLEHGAPVDGKDMFGRTHLWTACHNGNIDHVRLLLDHGANMEDVGSDSDSALHVACRKGRVECVRELLDRGADIHKKSSFGLSVLHLVCDGSDYSPACAAVLLEYGADLSPKDCLNRTPAMRAAEAAGTDPSKREFADALKLANRDREAAIEQLRKMDVG